MRGRWRLITYNRLHELVTYLMTVLAVVHWFLMLIWVLLNLSSKVKADWFYPSGDILNCHFVPALAVGISSLPERSETFSFNVNNVKGASAYFLGRKNILDFVDVRRGHVKRFDIAHSVSVPPLAKVQFWFYGYNFSGHLVNINRVALGLPGDGNLSNMLSVASRVDNIAVNYAGKHLYRVIYPVNIHFSCSKNPKQQMCKYKLAEFTVKEPLQVELRPLDCNFKEKFANLNLCITNIYGIKNEAVDISLKTDHSVVFANSLAIKPKQKICKIIRFNIENISNEQLLLEVTRKFADTVCLAHKDSRGDSFDMTSRAIFVARDDKHSKPGWSAYQPGFAVVGNPKEKTFCITRIPYKRIYKLDRCILPYKTEIKLQMPKLVKWGDEFEAIFTVRNLGKKRLGEFTIHFDNSWVDKYRVKYKNKIVPLTELKSINFGFLEVGESKTLRLHFIPINIHENYWQGIKPFKLSIEDKLLSQKVVKQTLIENYVFGKLFIDSTCKLKNSKNSIAFEIKPNVSGISFTYGQICIYNSDNAKLSCKEIPNRTINNFTWSTEVKYSQSFNIVFSVFSGDKIILQHNYSIKHNCWQNKWQVLNIESIPDVVRDTLTANRVEQEIYGKNPKNSQLISSSKYEYKNTHIVHVRNSVSSVDAKYIPGENTEKLIFRNEKKDSQMLKVFQFGMLGGLLARIIAFKNRKEKRLIVKPGV